MAWLSATITGWLRPAIGFAWQAARRTAPTSKNRGRKTRDLFIAPGFYVLSGLAQRFRLHAEAGANRVLDAVEEHELELVARFLRHVLEVLLVAPRQHHRLDAGAQRGESLLLDPADRQHQPAQRDLAGHGYVRANGFVFYQRD